MITQITTNTGKRFTCNYVSLADLFDELYVSIESAELVDIWQTFTNADETKKLHVEIVDNESYQAVDYEGYTNMISIQPEKSILAGGVLVRLNRAASNPSVMTIQNGS